MPLEFASLLHSVVMQATTAYHLPLQMHKCTFHVPAPQRGDITESPSLVEQLPNRIEYSAESVVLFGTESCGDIAVPFHQPQLPGQLPVHAHSSVKRKHWRLQTLLSR